jgi:succinoglycan biosynthesis transport protein ExoP
MSFEQILGAIWRRKVLFLVTLGLCIGAVAVLTYSVPKTYRATATLFVGERRDDSEALAFDTNIGEQLARTYTTLASHPNVAEEVSRRLPRPIARDELLDRMSFVPVERTQLLEITGSGPSPGEAQQVTNTYARTFVERVSGQFDRGGAPTRISLNEPAARPISPASPNVPLYLGFGFLLSLLLALGVVLLRERLDDSLHLADDEDELFGRPLLARIPEFADARSSAARASIADAFRLLKINADFAAEGRGRVLAVTSSGPVEGKSTTAAQLALTAAADGEKVVLVEADLRRPGLVGTELGGEYTPPRIGLSNLLVGVADIDDVLTPHPSRPGLTVVWPGPLPPNPGALLRSQRFDALLDELRARFDRVIIDTSPISVGADASLAVTRADGTLYVVDRKSTRQSQARAGLNQLDTARARVLGMVINRAAVSRDTSYGYYAPQPTAAANGDAAADRGERPARRQRQPL